MKKYKLGIVVTHPIQYQVPLYRYLESHSNISPVLFFLTNHGIQESFDPGFQMSIKYDIPLLEGYSYKFLTNFSPKPSPSTFIGAMNPGLTRQIANRSVDILLFHGWHSVSNFIGLSTAKLARIPYMMRCETKPDSKEMSRLKLKVKHAAIEPLIKNSSACLSIGKSNNKFYLNYGAEKEKIFSAPYSIDTERFEIYGNQGRNLRSEYLTKLNLNPKLPTVLYAAKLQSWKRPLDLVYAVDLLEEKPNVVIIGTGPLIEDLNMTAESRPWLKVIGFVNQIEIGRWFGVGDIFVLPSSHEPWGLVVNEAMSGGMTPIVSDSVGCKDDLVTPELGAIYKTGDIEDLANTLKNVMTTKVSDDHRKKVQSKSREYSISATAAGIQSAVEWVLK